MLIAELRALDPTVANAALRLLSLVDSFRTTPVQTLALLPELR